MVLVKAVMDFQTAALLVSNLAYFGGLTFIATGLDPLRVVSSMANVGITLVCRLNPLPIPALIKL